MQNNSNELDQKILEELHLYAELDYRDLFDNVLDKLENNAIKEFYVRELITKAIENNDFPVINFIKTNTLSSSWRFLLSEIYTLKGISQQSDENIKNQEPTTADDDMNYKPIKPSMR